MIKYNKKKKLLMIKLMNILKKDKYKHNKVKKCIMKNCLNLNKKKFINTKQYLRKNNN